MLILCCPVKIGLLFNLVCVWVMFWNVSCQLCFGIQKKKKKKKKKEKEKASGGSSPQGPVSASIGKGLGEVVGWMRCVLDCGHHFAV